MDGPLWWEWWWWCQQLFLLREGRGEPKDGCWSVSHHWKLCGKQGCLWLRLWWSWMHLCYWLRPDWPDIMFFGLVQFYLFLFLALYNFLSFLFLLGTMHLYLALLPGRWVTHRELSLWLLFQFSEVQLFCNLRSFVKGLFFIWTRNHYK